MDNFYEEYITIGNQEIVRIIDKDGIKWYPISSFFKKVLLKSFNTSYYRDSSLIKYMRVFKFKFKNQKRTEPIKTWFITEYGLIQILKDINVIQDGSVKSKIRISKLYDACKYFNIETYEDLMPIYTYTHPNIEPYNDWDRICIQNDDEIKEDTLWKMCESCHNYYPNTYRYFDKTKDNSGKERLKRKCKKCYGGNLINKDDKIQKDFKNGGVELVKYLLNNNYNKALKHLYENNIQYTPTEFYDKDIIISLIRYIKSNIIKNSKDFYITNISKIIKIKPQELKDIIDNRVNIGYSKPIPRKKKKIKKIITEQKLVYICRRRFKDKTISSDKINIKDINPIIGIITKVGLVIICKNPKKIKYAKIYKFTESVVGMENTLRAIERLDNES